MTERRILDSDFEQKIYDGYVNHPRELNESCTPTQFSPVSSVCDDLFRLARECGHKADQERDLGKLFYPAPQHKRPAYWAGVDLFEGSAERGTTGLIEQWRAGGNIRHPGFIFSRYVITKLATYSQTVAVVYDDTIYYEWGGLPGHRFPAEAVPFVPGREWMRMVERLKFARQFEKGSFSFRKANFAKYIRTVRELPKRASAALMLEQHGIVGLLRIAFGQRWDALVTGPNMRLATGISHCYVKDDSGEQYLLCSMDDAVHHKLKNIDPCEIYDLRRSLEIKA